MIDVIDFFSIGTSLATMKNIQTLIEVPPTYIDTGRIPLVGAVERRVGTGRMRADGFIQTPGIQFDKLTRDEYRTLLLYIFGDYYTKSVRRFVSWVDDLGFYTPFYGWIDRPTGLKDFTPHRLRPTTFPLRDLIMQSTSKSGNYTVVPGDNLIFVDTTGGDVTLTLEDAADFEPGVAYRFIKTVAANDLIVDADGSQTIDGATTITVENANEQVQLVSNGVDAWQSVSDED